MMKRLVCILGFVLGCGLIGHANNVRITGDVRVKDTDIDRETHIATVTVKLAWDNSWRDAFNYDAVYLFLKYKVDGLDEEWHHAYLEPTGHVVPAGFSYLMSNSKGGAAGSQKHNEGMFIYRTDKGYGDVAEMELKLKWDIESNSDKKLNRDLFTAGSVFLSAMAIEMVYVPRGAFRAGDTYAAKTFRNGDIVLPAGKNILTPDNVAECRSAAEIAANPAGFAVNLMNDISKDNSNAWVGRTSAPEGIDYVDYWQVTFNTAQKIRSFAIESIEGGTPTEWQLQIMPASGGGQWKAIYPKVGDNNVYADGSEWAVNSRQTYPCTRTLRIPDEFNESSSNYRILIKSTTHAPVIKNIAMSTEDILAQVDNSVLVYDSVTTLNNRYGLYAEDNDTWSGVTSAQYPNGYKAFFAMKYEVSQEQYVAFLNKLTAAQQRVRTIGSALSSLQEGMYVFGGGNGARPVGRNGIKLASIGVNDAPYVFANDLDPSTDYSQDGDGQTLACNFLNAGDMIAYADWCGLRPLTEMEYEKMSRRPFPEPALRGEYAWNTNANFNAATALQAMTAGKRAEKVSGGNVNAENRLAGPVRCGTFASTSTDGQIGAGASFWGVMELSGNLAEIYYNVNSEGRLFQGLSDVHHGDGKISAAGAGDVDNRYWPVEPRAFALRGGSYVDEKARTYISDRQRNLGTFGSVTELNSMKDSTMTFRLGRTAPVDHRIAEVVMENGMTSATAARDSVCSGSDYTIAGNVPGGIEGAYRIAWFTSSDGGNNWDLLEGEEAPSLKLYNLRNVNSREDVFKDYWYKRYVYTNKMDFVQSNPVCLRVINHTLKLSTDRDTVDVYDRSRGIRIESPQEAVFTWRWIRENRTDTLDVEYVLKPKKIEKHYFKYTDFEDGDQFTGDRKVVLEIEVMNKCPQIDTIRVFVKTKPKEVNNYDNETHAHNTKFKCGDILIDNEEEVSIKKSYRTIEIGGRCWFADNLDRTLGGSQAQGKTLCYGNAESNCKVYGRLYNWTAATQNNAAAGVQGICPTGWHLPTNQEWVQMLQATGGSVNTAGNGRQLKSTLNNWKLTTENIIGTNDSCFTAMPGGGYFWTYNNGNVATHAGITLSRNYLFGGTQGNGTGAFWWTSTNATHYWMTGSNSGSYNIMTVPYYVRFDNATNQLITNVVTAWSTYGYLNSVFCSGSQSHLANSYNSSGLNAGESATALNSARNNFYFSVRCIKDE